MSGLTLTYKVETAPGMDVTWHGGGGGGRPGCEAAAAWRQSLVWPGGEAAPDAAWRPGRRGGTRLGSAAQCGLEWRSARRRGGGWRGLEAMRRAALKQKPDAV
jgi:hypothetical protein